MHFVCKLMHLFCIMCIFFRFFIEARVPGWTRIIKMWLNKCIAEHSAKLFSETYIFPVKKFNFPFTLFVTFSAIGSPDIVLSNTHPRYVTCECYFMFIWLYLIFSCQAFFDPRLLTKWIDLVLPSPKCMLSTNQWQIFYNLLSTNQLQIFSKSLLSCFLISSTSLYKMHESSAYKSQVDLTAWGISFT